jgi:nitrogen fixation protein FixH
MPNNRSKIPYIFITFFAIIFAVNFFYIYLANKTWRGISTENSYQKGLDYNSAIKARQAQKKLGWSLGIKYEKNILEACLKNKNYFIKDAKLTAKITRPTQEGYDFTQDLSLDGNCYQTAVDFPLKGQWDIEIQAFRGADIFQEVNRIVVQK